MNNYYDKMTIILVSVLLSGCVMTTTTRVVEMDRVDQQLSGSGNRGYLAGKPSDGGETQPRKTTRQVIRTDIELPTLSELQKPSSKDEEPNGNRGYLQQEYNPSPMTSSVAQEPDSEMEAEVSTHQEENLAEAIQQLEPLMTAETQAAKETKFEEYVIQKGDTLQSIAAKPNVYGKASKWVKLYGANKDVIKNPNRVYPGLKIRIPRD
jgi:LysM repeat protein